MQALTNAYLVCDEKIKKKYIESCALVELNGQLPMFDLDIAKENNSQTSIWLLIQSITDIKSHTLLLVNHFLGSVSLF